MCLVSNLSVPDPGVSDHKAISMEPPPLLQSLNQWISTVHPSAQPPPGPPCPSPAQNRPLPTLSPRYTSELRLLKRTGRVLERRLRTQDRLFTN